MTTTTDIKKYETGKGENKESPSRERNTLVQVEGSWEFRVLLTGRRRRRRQGGEGGGGRGGGGEVRRKSLNKDERRLL